MRTLSQFMRFCFALMVATMVVGCQSHPKHLYVVSTGDDLGLWIKGTVAFDETLNGTRDFAKVSTVYFATPHGGCMFDDSVVDLTEYDQQIDYYTDGFGRVMQPTFHHSKLLEEMQFTGSETLNSTCSETPITVAGFYFTYKSDDKGLVHVSTYNPNDLVVR